MCIHMLVYMYIHIHRWMNTILSQNIPPPPPPFWLKISFLQNKGGTIATAGGVPCYVQCNIPTWTVRKDLCTHEKMAMDNPFYAENFLSAPFMQKIFCYAAKFSFMQKIFCYAEKFLLCRKIFFYAKNFLLCRKFSFMQKNKNFCYTEKFLLCRKFFFYAKKNSVMQKNSIMQKISVMQKNFLLCSLISVMHKNPFYAKNFFWA